MYKILCLISLFFLSIYTYSQENNSLNKELEKNMDKGFSFCYKNKDSLYYYLEKAKNDALKVKDIENLVMMYNIESWGANYFDDLQKVKKNISELDSLLSQYQIKFDQLPNKVYLECQTNYTNGAYYYELKDYMNARPYFDAVLNICKKLPGSSIDDELFKLQTGSNNYLGLMFSKEQKHLLAEESFNRNVRLIRSRNLKDNRQLYNTFMHLANIYRQKKEYSKANKYILNCIPYYKNIRKNTNRVVSGYHRVIENHLDLKRLDSAKYYLRLIKGELVKNHPMWSRYYEVSAKVFEAENDPKNSLHSLNESLDLIRFKWNDKPHLEIAEVYQKIGQLHAKFNLPKKAIKNYDLAISQFSKASLNYAINKTILFKILKNKGIALNKLEDYKSSLIITQKAMSILDSLKPDFKTNSDKLFLVENAFPVFESALEADYELYQATNNKTFIDKAFFVSEKSKSTLLLEGLLSTQANNFADIPDYLIEKEQQLKAQITGIEKRINKKATDKLKDQLFYVKKDHRALIDTIEVRYKNYYDLKYNTQVSALDTIQDTLDANQAMISYFYGSKAIYIITIGKVHKSFKKILLNESLETLIKQTQSLLSNSKSDVSALAKKTNQLYATILKPVIKNIKKKHLIIIPDGLLNYIPFGSLNTSNSSIRYLIEDKTISYINSATLLNHLEQREINTDVLAFAPSFDGHRAKGVSVERNKLLPLVHNTTEAQQVLDHFKGTLYLNEKASLQNFMSNIKEYGVIHLATHAIFNDTNPEYSYLAFADTTNEESLFYASDLYNTQLKANLVTLSACETGIGVLKRGEGFLSLSRSFFYAGASSIANTLWKVNDASSTALMNDFYQELAQGETKDKALQQSKINFLYTNKDTALSHPYYWSGFIVSGNTNPLIKTNYWLWIGLGLIALLGIFFYVRRKKI